MTARDEWDALRAFTPARVALGRAGNGLPTSRVLEFQLAHARARDAVYAPLNTTLAGTLNAVSLTTKASDRATYLTNPDLGRALSSESLTMLQAGRYDAVLVIADGLSATAINLHATDLAKAIFGTLPELAWASTCLISNGRVAVGDEIAAILGAEMAVVAIGERPGLSSADSLGVYLTFGPKPGITKDADRNCISNVRPGGLPLGDAAKRLAWLMRQARRLRLTGTGLKEDAPDGLLTESR